MMRLPAIFVIALMMFACVPSGQKYEILNAEFGRSNAGFYTFGAEYEGANVYVNISGHTLSPFPGTYKVYLELRNCERDSIRFDPTDMWLEADGQAYTLEGSYVSRCCDGQTEPILLTKGKRWWCTLYFANKTVERVANNVQLYLGDITVGESGDKLSIDVIRAELQEHGM